MRAMADKAAEAPPRLGRPPALSPQDRRAALTAAAGRVFMKEGFAGATMERIAAEAGMSKRTLYRFFPDKTAALEALLCAHEQRFALPPTSDAPGTDPRAEIRAVLLALTDYLLGEDQLALARLVIAEAPHHPALAEGFERLEISGVERRVQERFARLAQQAGHDPQHWRALAELMIGALIGPAHLAALAGPPGQTGRGEALETRVDRVIAAFTPALGLKG